MMLLTMLQNCVGTTLHTNVDCNSILKSNPICRVLVACSSNQSLSSLYVYWCCFFAWQRSGWWRWDLISGKTLCFTQLECGHKMEHKHSRGGGGWFTDGRLPIFSIDQIFEVYTRQQTCVTRIFNLIKKDIEKGTLINPNLWVELRWLKKKSVCVHKIVQILNLLFELQEMTYSCIPSSHKRGTE